MLVLCCRAQLLPDQLTNTQLLTCATHPSQCCDERMLLHTCTCQLHPANLCLLQRVVCGPGIHLLKLKPESTGSRVGTSTDAVHCAAPQGAVVRGNHGLQVPRVFRECAIGVFATQRELQDAAKPRSEYEGKPVAPVQGLHHLMAIFQGTKL